jgi:uncharacterized small protein (DUF1192 family)
MGMTDGQWTTYNEAAVRLGISSDAVRRRAARGHWARTRGNDGLARIQVPDDVSAPRRGDVQGDTAALVSSLEAHIATLKTEIERLTAELAGERAVRQGEVELLKGQLVTERERADREMVEFAGERAGRQADQEHAAARQADQEQQLAAARAAADKATAELVELARRLAAIAETQTSAEPEPPRHWAIRAWRWMQKTA